MKKELLFALLFAVALLVLSPAAAYANLMWPASIFYMALYSQYAIAFGLIAEWAFVKYFTTLGIGMSLFVALLMNALTALVGLVVTPLVYSMLEIFPGYLFEELFDTQRMSWPNWILAFVIVAAINAVFETIVVRKFWNSGQSFRQTYDWVFGANIVSNAAALVVILLDLS